MEAGNPGNDAAIEAWNRFGSDLTGFEEQAAVIRAEGAPDNLGGVGKWQLPEFPYSSADALLENSEQLEQAFLPGNPIGDDAPVTAASDMEAWLAEERLLAAAAIDASLAVDAFQLELLTTVSRERLGELDERLFPADAERLRPPLGFADSALAGDGRTLGLFAEAQPLFARAVQGPRGFEHANAHVQQPKRAAEGKPPEYPKMHCDIDRAIAHLVEASRKTALDYSALPLSFFSSNLIEANLGSVASNLFSLVEEWKGWRRPALGFFCSMLRKLLRASELRDNARLEGALALIEAKGLAPWLSSAVNGRADGLLRGLASAQQARARIFESLEKEIHWKAWSTKVWKPVLEQVLPRHDRSQRRAQKVARAAGLTAPLLNTVGLATGPVAVLAVTTCGVGYSVISLADRLDAPWLDPLGRHQGLPSLVDAIPRRP